VGAAQGWLLGRPMPADEFVRSCRDLTEAAEV
jgi:sensor c-di-GMP phosphodiesterase-like protein